MILVGRLDQDNAKRRRQGVIDALLGRPKEPSRNDPPGGEIKSDDGKFVILGTMTDQFDRAKAKANAEDAVTRHPDITAMVGLFEYNPQMIIEALDRLGKLGQVKVMGFDENPVLLESIKQSTAIGTVVQNPYEYGYKSIATLHRIKQGDKSAIPENKFIDIPARVIDASNVDAFRSEMEERLQKK
jgi:ribose transport system substrate-binding protein